MSENELSNGFDTDGISKLNRETDDADEENIDISTIISISELYTNLWKTLWILWRIRG